MLPKHSWPGAPSAQMSAPNICVMFGEDMFYLKKSESLLILTNVLPAPPEDKSIYLGLGIRNQWG